MFTESSDIKIHPGKIREGEKRDGSKPRWSRMSYAARCSKKGYPQRKRQKVKSKKKYKSRHYSVFKYTAS